jgi:glyoxylase-like metal-dependent hydrolase (beta-lactamase superfamily II)
MGRFTEIADRVWTARYPQWDVTVGLVRGRDGAVLVDTRASATQGRELIAELRTIDPMLRVEHVVNTHVHFDHTFGNVAFDRSTIHAHENVARAAFSDAVRVKGLLRADPEGHPPLGYTADDVAHAVATIIRPADATFTEREVIDLGDREVTLSYAGRGHTDGDITVAVSGTPVLFVGDLIEQSGPPSLGGDCWPLEWAGTLDAIRAHLPPDAVLVPGHGTPVDPDFVARQREELDIVATVIRQRRFAGMSLADACHEPDERLPYPLESLATAFARGWEQLRAPGPGEG